MNKLFQAITLFLCISSVISKAQVPVITLVEFSTGYTSPLDVQNCGDSRLFVVQQNGYIYICDSSGIKNPTPFLDVHTLISQSSERGLLGLAFHPKYFDNGYFFIYYTKLSDGSLRISRFSVDSLNPDVADPASELNLIEIPHPSYNNHNGGCLHFGPDGYLYAGTGDGGSAGDPSENAQNTKKYLGKMLRFDVDNGSPYAIPPDNPFVDDSINYYPEIWAIGMRNPWRYSFDLVTGDLWIGDVGQNTWEEVDYAMHPDTGGQNYGWDCYEGTHTYEPNNCNGTSGLTFPVHEYQHTSGSNGDCTITGGYVYRGAKNGNLYGKYVFADYCSGKISVTTQSPSGIFTTALAGDELILQDEFAFSSFGEDRYGELYVCDITHGKIYSVMDTACKPTAAIVSDISSGAIIDSVSCENTLLETAYGPGMNYQWQFNGNDIAGATSSSYFPGDTGVYTVQVTNGTGCSAVSAPVTVGAFTPADFSGLDSLYCLYQPPVALVGNPAGGVFTGDGIDGNTFDPALAGIGVHSITYTYVNEFGCTATSTLEALVDPCTGLNDNWEKYGINLFPNPNNGVFTIILKDTNEQITEVSIWSLSGQLVSSLQLPQIQSTTFTMNVSNVSEGLYLLRIHKANSIIWQKVVIENAKQ